MQKRLDTGQKTEIINVRCTKAEKRRLKKKAKDSTDSTLSAYLREKGLEDDPGERFGKRMETILQEVDKMNQLLRMISGSTDEMLKEEVRLYLSGYADPRGGGRDDQRWDSDQ